MSKISEALEAWRRAIRELEATMPGAPAWYRARVQEEDRRADYQIAAAESQRRHNDESNASEFLTVESPVLARNVTSAVRSTTAGETAQRDARPVQTPLSRR
jgi:hypothetical protein